MKAYRKWKNVPSGAGGGAGGGKGKRYVYFKQMMFMIPSIEKRWNAEGGVKGGGGDRTAGIRDRETPEKIEDDRDVVFDDEQDEEAAMGAALGVGDPQIYEPVIEITSTGRKRPRIPPPLAPPPSQLSAEHAEVVRALLRRHRDDEDDDDKMFLLSLLPSFKKMDEDVKFASRIEILQVVRRNLQQNNYFPAAAAATAAANSAAAAAQPPIL